MRSADPLALVSGALVSVGGIAYVAMRCDAMRCDAWLAEERVLAEVYGVVVTQHLRWRKGSAIGCVENLEWPLSGSARTLAQFWLKHICLARHNLFAALVRRL
jgi:hypothetical protein